MSEGFLYQYYIDEFGDPPIGAETAHSLHPSLQNLHGQPKILTRVHIPTTRYITDSTIGYEPRSRFTMFKFEPIS